MSGVEMVQRAQHDVGELQSALTTVQTGLDTVELAAVTVDTARRGLRRCLKITLVLAIVGAIVIVVTAAARSKTNASETELEA